MKVTTKYSEVEKITYTFDTVDIRRALLDTFKIKPGAGVVDVELHEEWRGEPQYAELIITFKINTK